MITNELTNHADWIRNQLSRQSLAVPDRLLGILDTRARYKTGVAGTGFSLNYLADTPNVLFYRGADRLEAQENEPSTTQIIVPWTNMMVPVQFTGTELEETRGLRADVLTDENFSLRDMGTDDRLIFLDWIMSRTAATASALQTARVQTLWGKEAKIANPGAVDRQPINVKDIFDDTTGLYGEPISALGKFEAGHPWAEDYAFGASKAYKMSPRVFYFNDVTADGASANKGSTDAAEAGAALSLRAESQNHTNPANNIERGEDLSPARKFQRLYEIVSELSQVVQGTKLAICDNSLFTSIAFEFKDSDKFPMLVGTDQWSYTIRSVQIEDTYFISDPNKPQSDNSIDIYPIGEADGTGYIFPFYWESGMSVSESMQRQNDYMLRDVPDGMTFGSRRDIPFYIDKFTRFPGMADAIGTNERLKWMLVVTEPWAMCQIRKITA